MSIVLKSELFSVRGRYLDIGGRAGSWAEIVSSFYYYLIRMLIMENYFAKNSFKFEMDIYHKNLRR